MIWCVGEIYADSAQPWLPYNAVHWDGSEWELKRIQVFYNGGYITPPLDGIFTFSENDIWVTSGVAIHGNGRTWTIYHLWDMGVLDPDDGGVTKIWGSSSNDVNFVGRRGTVVHYTGSVWQKIESGTDVDLLDVWGSPDGSVVWACGTEVGKPTVLLRIGNGISEMVYEDTDYLFQVREDTLSGRLVSGLAFDNRFNYVLSSLGLYRLPTSKNNSIKRLSFSPNFFPGFPRRVDGNGHNDLTIAGDFYMIAHYNGSTWRHYEQIMAQGRFFSVSQKENLIVAVGHSVDLLSKGIILVGRR